MSNPLEPCTAAAADSMERLGEHLDRLRRDTLQELEELQWRWHHLESELERTQRRLQGPASEAFDAARTLVRQVTRGCADLCDATKK